MAIAEAKEHSWSDALADVLVERYDRSEKSVVTWLNHYSALMSMDAGVQLRAFDFVGVDGAFLSSLVTSNGIPRTSADLVLPRLLPRLRGARIALVGGTDQSLAEAGEALEQLVGDGTEVVLKRNGFGAPITADGIAAAETAPDVVIIGMGAPQQDLVAQQFAAMDGGPALVLTCGGWLDQIVNVAYYPPWAYRFKLNWLIRLVREPRRLWRRYTVHAMRARLSATALRTWITDENGFQQYTTACLVTRG